MGNAEQTEGGIVTERNVRQSVECLLDVLLRTGELGSPDADEARRRFEAGMWLRELYIERAQLSPTTSLKFDSSGRRADFADAIPEDVAWNIKVFQDAMRECKPYGTMLTAVCCHDDDGYPRNGIARALTKLADHRGI